MIHDSSSSGEGSDEDFPRELIRNNSREQRPFSSFSTPSSTPRGSLVSGLNNLNTTPSPTPSLQSLQSELLEFQEREERKEILQLYVFVLRCISYPFNAKQPTDLARRQAKVSKLQLHTIKDRFEAFLDGNTRINSDEAFYNAVKAYFDIFICSERVLKLVVSGGCSANDFREVFKGIIEKRVRFLPEIHGLSKETVLSAWMAKFDSIYRGEDDYKRGSSRIAASAASELMLSKEQLYEMFQTILDIKKFEHQILYNACQLDNADEQAACIRRELQNKMRSIGELRKRLPPFLHKDMEKLFVEEQQKDINTLMQALESLPVSRSGASEKYSLYKYKKAQNTFVMDVPDDAHPSLAISDVVLSFTIEVVVAEARGLKSLQAKRIVYCTMEVEGGEKLQTGEAEAVKPVWDTQGDFTTCHPRPIIKIKLYEERSGVLALDDKELGRLTIKPSPGGSDAFEWHTLTPHKGWTGPKLELRLAVKMDKPLNLKKAGFLYAHGKSVWKKWKKRFLILVQVSHCTFALCSYVEKKSEPTDMLQVDGYTVDYCDKPAGEEHNEARFFFEAVKEGDQILFGTEEELERTMWVNKLYMATGQSHKPIAPKLSMVATAKESKTNTLGRAQGAADHAKKLGLDALIQATPNSFDHHYLFEVLQRKTLGHRLNDSYSCLGWFSPGQVFVLEEYCARYGVRGCHRHLCYLSDLLDRAESGIMIDPTLLHYSFAFCASHVHGNRPDGIGTITTEEKSKFEDIKDRLWNLLAHQIVHFRYCFPFGRPEGALKATLSLFERVMMKDTSSPVPAEEFRNEIRKCLQQAALVNYTRVSDYAQIEETSKDDASPDERLQGVLHLADLCIDLLQQNEEHHSEAFAWVSDLMTEHQEIFWSLYSVDMDEALATQPPDTWDSFQLFQLLNEYLSSDSVLCRGKFHIHLRETFAPLVIRYLDLMESSIAQSLHREFEKETWVAVGAGCNSSEELFWKLGALQKFVTDLNWPDEVMEAHLVKRLKLMSSDMVMSCVKRTREAIEKWIKNASFTMDSVIPNKVMVMLNVISQAKTQSKNLCASEETESEQRRYHSDVSSFLSETQKDVSSQIITKLNSVTESLLHKLSRYDQGSILSSVYSALKNPGDELYKGFNKFLRENLKQVMEVLKEEQLKKYIVKLWYTPMLGTICEWLSHRLSVSLHVYQLKTLLPIAKELPKIFQICELYGLPAKRLRCPLYGTLLSRLHIEEAMLKGEQIDCIDDYTGYKHSDDSSSEDEL